MKLSLLLILIITSTTTLLRANTTEFSVEEPSKQEEPQLDDSELAKLIKTYTTRANLSDDELQKLWNITKLGINNEAVIEAWGECVKTTPIHIYQLGKFLKSYPDLLNYFILVTYLDEQGYEPIDQTQKVRWKKFINSLEPPKQEKNENTKN